MTTRLKIYRAQSGQWSGVLIRDDEEIGRIAGCTSPAEVEAAANDQGFDELIVERVPARLQAPRL